MSATLSGHLWTIGPSLWGRILTPRSSGEAWTCSVPDERHGSILLRGQLHTEERHTTLCLIVHGLGGSAESPYMHRCVAACGRAGVAALRLSLRGADRQGEDIYHAGLVRDLGHVLAHPSLARFDRIIVIGYSLGGHVALHLGIPTPRVGKTEETFRPPAAIATLCSPLDLRATAKSFDAGPRWLYRRHVLDGLRQMYAAIAHRGRAWVDASELAAIDGIQQWDETVVAPRFGFPDAATYYRAMSVGPKLDQIRVPTLVLHGRADPMVRWHTVERWHTANSAVELDVLSGGGHCGFLAMSTSRGRAGTVNPSRVDASKIACSRGVCDRPIVALRSSAPGQSDISARQ